MRETENNDLFVKKVPDSRPEIAGEIKDFAQYQTILLGFPVWWYVEPRIIDTFLESYDFMGKTIVLFATSGSSGIGKTGKELASSCPGAKIIEGRMLNGNPSEAELKKWVESL